ncbi:hypothetical protein OY671_008446, partial [Metschnikowia pulcherrima]
PSAGQTAHQPSPPAQGDSFGKNNVAPIGEPVPPEVPEEAEAEAFAQTDHGASDGGADTPAGEVPAEEEVTAAPVPSSGAARGSRRSARKGEAGMIHPRRLKGTPANIARYYTIGDYYTKGGNEPSEWGGKLAKSLGSSGEVDPKQFEESLSGKVGDQQLGRRRKEGIQHHPGWDFTISAPKSISISASVTGDERILAAHERAVGVALAFAEEHAESRRRVEREIVHETTGRVSFARFTEHSSREGDPHSHTHAVLLNMTNHSNGD